VLQACGLLHLVDPRDEFLASLCRFTLVNVNQPQPPGPRSWKGTDKQRTRIRSTKAPSLPSERHPSHLAMLQHLILPGPHLPCSCWCSLPPPQAGLCPSPASVPRLASVLASDLAKGLSSPTLLRIELPLV